MRIPFHIISYLTVIAVVHTFADDAPSTASPALSALYQESVFPANIAPTPATQPSAQIHVLGQPRMTEGHPCTLWDKEDIEHIKEQLKTNPDVQVALAKLRAQMDKRITQPLNVPVPLQAADGSWTYTGDLVTSMGTPASKFGLGFNSATNASDIANLGIMYALTGDEKYGEFAKKMVLAYADGYNKYGHPPGWTVKSYRSALDGRLTGQFLDDGFWLNEVAFGYDLIHDLPSFTPDEHTHIRDDLFKAISAEFFLYADRHQDYVSQTNNRSALCASGVLMAGYATEDPELINNALYGVGGTKDTPTGGLVQVHFGQTCITDDGLWSEGAIAYQTGIAACGLFNDAETLWHHGIDMYRYRDGVLKRFLDSSLHLAYPDDKLTIAALHDSGRFALIDPRDWLNNEVGVPFEDGYRRYQDFRYIPIIRNASKTLSMTIHGGGPSLFLDLPDDSTVPPRPVESANFYSVGYGVLRLPAGGNPIQLLMEYGPSGSHGHPSKLGMDLYALGDTVMPFPGVIFPYSNPLDVKWYWTTVGNCAMSVDEASQVYMSVKWKYPKDTPDPIATQLVFAPAQTMGMQRAWSNTLYKGVTQDRSLFLTDNYVADIFGSFSDDPHEYDLAWHLRGQLTPSLKLDPFQFPDPIANGYNALGDVAHALTDQEWSATETTPNNQTVRFFAAAGPGTEVISGTGHFFTKNVKEDEAPPTLIERRTGQKEVLFGNAIDISGSKDGFVKGVAQEGSLADGYGMLKVQTIRGTDLCFASYRPGQYQAGGLETDATQALVRMDGTNVTAMYLAGGKTLKVAGGALTRSEPGLASIEQTAPGVYVLANPSPSAATITVAVPALAGLQAFQLDDKGQRSGSAKIAPGVSSKEVSMQLDAGAKIEFASGAK